MQAFLILGALGWSLSFPFNALALGSSWGLLFLALTAYFVSRYLKWPLAVLFGAGLLLGGRIHQVAEAWFLPVALYHLMLRQDLPGRRPVARLTRSVGKPWRPPSFWLWLLAPAPVAASALAVVVIGEIRGRAPFDPLALLCGALFFLSGWCRAIAGSFKNPAMGVEHASRQNYCLQRGMLLCLAGSTVGTWTLRESQQHHGVLRSAPILVAAFAALAYALTFPATFSVARSGVRLRVVSAVLPSLVSRYAGEFLFWIAAVFAHDDRLLAASVVLLVIDAVDDVRILRTDKRDPLSVGRRTEAAFLAPLSTGEVNDFLLNVWITERIERDLDHPDLSPLHTMAAEAMAAGAGDRQSPLADAVAMVQGEPKVALSAAQRAEHWLQAFDSCRLMFPWSSNPAYEREISLAEAHRAYAAASVHHRLIRREEAVREYREAAALWTECGLPNLAALSVMGASTVIGLHLGPAEEALAELRGLIEDPALCAVVREYALALSKLIYGRLSSDEHRPPSEALPRTIAPDGRDRRVLDSELRVAQCGTLGGQNYRGLRTMVEKMQAAAREPAVPTRRDVPAPHQGRPRRVTPAYPAIPTLTWPESTASQLVRQARRRWSVGRWQEATRLLEQAADQRAHDGSLRNAHTVRLNLGLSLRVADPAGAYRNLCAVLDLEETMRLSAIGSDRRISVSGRSAPVYEHLVMLLISASDAGSDGATGLPSEPLIAAFELAERGRSRGLVEALGSDTALPVPAGGAAAVERERSALAVLSRAATQQEGVGPALHTVRDAQSALTDAWQQLSELGDAGREYVQIRRADTVSFEQVRALLTRTPAQTTERGAS